MPNPGPRVLDAATSMLPTASDHPRFLVPTACVPGHHGDWTQQPSEAQTDAQEQLQEPAPMRATLPLG